jgi:hypothetical protein
MTNKQIEKIKVTSYVELTEAIKPFLPENNKSEARKSFIEGFEFVKRRKKFNDTAGNQLSTDDMRCWVDNVVKQRLGGRREGLGVVWDLPEGKFKLDPWTGKLEKEDQNAAAPAESGTRPGSTS